MLVRREQAGDVETVRDVVAAAFADTEAPERSPVEVSLLAELRTDPGWQPALSLVAVDPAEGGPGEGAVVGHVVCTRGTVGGVPALGLGPLAVRPDRQGRGVGSALMHAVLGAAEALDESLVALLGEPAYYGRFGFSPSSQHGIAPPEPQWGDYFQVRVLDGRRALVGEFSYAAPFRQL